MMKLFTLLLFIISSHCFSEEYYLYYAKSSGKEIQENLTKLDPQITMQEVYTEKEKSLLKNTGVHTDIFKIKTKLDSTQIKKNSKLIKLESVQKLSFLSLDYTERQWHLKNTGGDIYSWSSDIDRIRIQAKSGEDINAKALVETDKEIKVAVIDSGIDLNHPDLKNQIQVNPLECEALKQYQSCLASSTDRNSCHETYAKLDLNNNGYPLDCHGWSLSNNSFPGVEVEGNPEINDLVGHGTHVAGIIAAEENGFGTTGIIQNVKIIPIQVSMSSAAESAIEKMAKGVLYAIHAGAQVINLSLGWRTQFDSKMMREMIALATEKNILVVVAGGNSAHSDISYPCAYPDTICVGSHDETGNLSSFSNRGTSIDLIAPGSRILSTWPTNLRSKLFTPDDNYEIMSGTSQAAPVVTGVIAKLLNQGHSPSAVRFKILKGARVNKDTNSEIRFGNIDAFKAHNLEFSELIYPMNKTPYLIKWSKNNQHKFKLRLKNYGKTSENIKLRVESINPNQIIETGPIMLSKLQSGGSYETDIYFQDNSKIESELKFKLIINNGQETITYLLSAHYLRLVDESSQEDDLSEFSLLDEIEKNSILRPFNNITHDDGIDFFISHTKANKQFIGLLKLTEDGYKKSAMVPLKDKNPVFLNFSKVDLDGDALADYVVMYVVTDRAQNKTTKFKIFDHNLQTKRYLISPKNEFANDKTFIPGKFLWLKQDKLMVPAWIGYGEAAVNYYQSPWALPAPTTGNHFYYLTSEGLKNYKLAKDDILLHSLYQSQEQIRAGEVEFITTNEIGFEKSYSHLLLKQQPTVIDQFSLTRFFDILELRALHGSKGSANAFFHEESIYGAQNILVLKSKDHKLSDEFIKLENPLKSEAIQYVHSVDDETIFYQTNYQIGVFNRELEEHSLRVAKVDIKRRRYQLMLNTNTLYLPSVEAPGMTSELLRVSNGELVSDRRYRTLALNGCEEFGNVANFNEDYIGYLCANAAKILLLKIQ